MNRGERNRHDPVVLAIDGRADDLATLAALLAEVMPRARLLTAGDGRLGLELAGAADPDVILLDIVVPGMDGFEVCRRLKADERLEHIPVVFLTSVQADRRNRMKALAVGAEAFLAKPVDALELEAQVRAMAKIKAAVVRRRRESERLTEMVEARTRELAHELEERRRVEQDYQTLFREMREAFAVHELLFDDEGRPVDYRFVAVNPAFERMTGLSAERVVGRTVLELLPETERSWVDTYARVALTGEPVVFEDYSVALDRHFSVSAFRPAPNRFACVFTDISERLRQAREREELEARLKHQQKLEAIGTLAGGVAHEINNPIAIILSSAELICDDVPTGSPAATTAQVIVEAAGRVGKIVRNLLSFARQDRDPMEEVRVEQVVDGTIPLIRKLFERDRIACQVDVDASLPSVQGRSGQLAQVLMNLLTNARDAVNQRCPDGHGDKHVAVRVGRTESDGRTWVRLCVEDNGVGVDDTARSRLFDPFFTTKPRGVGTGLGLSISHGIVEEHGGRIWHEPREGGGARFVVLLPAAPT